MDRMNSDIKRLYWFHLLNSIAVTAVANFLFLDKLFLRLDMNMSQFGLIKGLGLWLPMMLNLLLAPWVMRLNADRQIVGFGYLVRVVLPFAFLGLPLLTRDPVMLTAGFSAILSTSMVFPILANNSIAVLMKNRLPAKSLGHHSSRLAMIWFIPYFVLTIPCSWYVEAHAHGSDSEFFAAMAWVFVLTGVFQLPASWVILRMKSKPPRVSHGPRWGLRDVFEPMREPRYRSLLVALVSISVMASMIHPFLYPYMLEARGWSMTQVSILSGGVGLVAAASMGWWGKMADRIGGRNVLRLALPAVALGVFCLTQDSNAAVIIFAVLAWMGEAGIFGAAIMVGIRYLTLAMSREDRSNIYLAAATAAMGTGVLIGSVSGGLLLDWLKTMVDSDQPLAHYQIYFTYCGLGYLVIGQWVWAMRDGRRRVTSRQLGLHVLRAMRSVAWRSR
jgi:hypothetical protein